MSSHGVIANILRMTRDRVEFLYLKRSGGRFAGQWWPVAGTLEQGETPLGALIRELKEETGLSPEKVFSLGMDIKHIDTGTPLEGFVVYVSENCTVSLNHEHSEFAWLEVEDLYSLLHKAVHPVIRHIEASFIEREPQQSDMVWCRERQ